MRGADCGTDHHMVRATVSLKPRVYPRKPQEPVYDSRSIQRRDIKEMFKQKILENLQNFSMDEITDVETTWNNVKKHIYLFI